MPQAFHNALQEHGELTFGDCPDDDEHTEKGF